MSYRLFLFDFDGTLADSREWFVGMLPGLAAEFGFRAVSREETETLRALPNREIIRRLGVRPWQLPAIARRMRALAARDAESIRLFPGIEALLERLAAAGAKRAIVSSNSEANVRRILGARLAGRIDVFACGASLFGKRAKLKAAARRAGVAPAECLAIGDETRDIEAARAAGMAAAAVLWGYATEEALRAAGPDHCFDRPEPIAALAA